jgi:hypothetical protein
LQAEAFGIGMSGADVTSPPLTKTLEGRVVECHGRVQSPNLAAAASQARAQFPFFSSDHELVESSAVSEGLGAVQGVTTAGVDLSRRATPLDVY